MSEDQNLVLVADDDPMMTELLKHIFEKDGYAVHSVNNGAAVLEFAQKVQPGLIVLDIMMPRMDGFEVLSALKYNPRTKTIPIIILTAKALEVTDVEHGFGLGADDYIFKPIEARELLARAKSKIRIQPSPSLFSEGEETDKAYIPNYHVFLSYSREDEEVMQRVRDDLKAKSLLVWVDQDGLRPGNRSWKKTIQKAIDGAGCVAVLLSPDAKESEWVEAELDYAEAQGKTIFPILARGTKQNAVPFGYTLAQWIDIVEKDYDSEMEKLIKAIRKHLNLT